MAERPDFEALRRERNERIRASMMEMARDLGWEEGDEPPTCSFDFGQCYCACASGGPCEHDWSGSREYETDGGFVSEAVCARCGMGAMSHSMRVGM